jgi:hypothetical protein
VVVIMGDKQITEMDLAQFTGSVNYYKHWSKRLLYTDGVQFLAERAGAHWLVDLVASYQPLKAEFQCWTLKTEEQGYSATCKDRDDMLVVKQKFEYTDFPAHLMPFDLYVQNGVLYLPSED